MHMITGAYIVVYIASVYVLLSVVLSKRRTMYAYSRWTAGANQVLLRLRVECPCLESQLLCSPWALSYWC